MRSARYWLWTFWLPRDRRELATRLFIAAWCFYRGYRLRRELENLT